MAERSYSPLDLETDLFDPSLCTEASERDFDKMIQDFKTAFYPGSLLASYMTSSPDLSSPLTPTSGAAWSRRRLGYDFEPELDAFAKGSDTLYSHLRDSQDSSCLEEVAEVKEKDLLPSVFRLDGHKSRKSKKKKKKKEKERETEKTKEKEKSKAQAKPVFPVARGLVPKNARRRVNFGNSSLVETQMTTPVRPATPEKVTLVGREESKLSSCGDKGSVASRSLSRGLLPKKDDEDLLQCFLPTSERPKTPAAQASHTSISMAHSPSFLSGRRSSSSMDADHPQGVPERGYSPSSSNLGSNSTRGETGRPESKIRRRIASGDQGTEQQPGDKAADTAATTNTSTNVSQSRRNSEAQNERKLDPKLIDFRRRPVAMKTTGFGRCTLRNRGIERMDDDGPMYGPHSFSTISRHVPRIPVTSASTLNQIIDESCEAVRNAARAHSSNRRLGWQPSSNNNSITSEGAYSSSHSSFEKRDETLSEDVDGLIEEIFSSVPRPPSRRH